MTTIAWQSWLEVHPETAATLALENGDIVQVSSAAGQLEVPIYLYLAIRPDTVALAFGQGHTDLGRYGRDRNDPDSLASRLLRNSRRQFRLLEHLGTEPAIYYLKEGNWYG